MKKGTTKTGGVRTFAKNATAPDIPKILLPKLNITGCKGRKSKMDTRNQAVISECEKYRYYLTRHTPSEHETKLRVLFVMLNPSTADARFDDPTIRRCIGFSKSWRYEVMGVVNLYGLRATDPKEMLKHSDPVGPGNDVWLRSALRDYNTVVCAWGDSARQDRVNEFLKIAAEEKAYLYCFGLTKSRMPKHPLFLSGNSQLEHYP